jgi:N-acetylmuramic acid 6-phosphate etherase
MPKRAKYYMNQIDDQFERLLSERRNPHSAEIGRKNTEEILRLINAEDQTVASVVERQIPSIAKAVEYALDSLREGGRLIYAGAGTSGRLGVLDAAECPPTFGTSPSTVQAIIAGGRKAMWRSVDGAEDDVESARVAIGQKKVGPHDTVIGLSASGKARFVHSILREARAKGAKTVLIACVERPPRIANVTITPLVGPEVITGSTRMKAGTAEKMILNMISTATMIRLGRVYGNLMIDLRPLSRKLRSRARRILKFLTGITSAEAEKLYEGSGRNIKVALVMALSGVNKTKARKALGRSHGVVSRAIDEAKGGF